MLINLEDISPIDCGEPVNGMQPAIIEVYRKGPREFLYSPVLVDREAGIAEMPIPYRFTFPDAFQAAIRLGENLREAK